MEDINNLELPPIQTSPEPQLPPVQPQPTDTPFVSPPIQEPINQNEKKTGIGFYVISIIVILFLSSACYVLAFRSKDVLNLTSKKNTDNPVPQTSQITPTIPTTIPTSTAELKETLKISNIQMDLPKGWTVSSVSGNTAKILTDFKPYQVYLNLRINRNDKLAEDDYISRVNPIKTQFGEVYSIDSGGGSGMTGALINGNKYIFSWEIESNQPVPTNLDGVWHPDNNITPTILLNITKTIRPLNQTVITPKINPDQVVLTFYQEYLKSQKGINGYKDNSSLTPYLINNLNDWYSTAFKGSGMYAGVDPIVFSKDYPSSFTAKISKQDKISASVILTENFTSKKDLNIELLNINGQWKINSITVSSSN